MCEEWQSFDNFCAWALANGYNQKLSIDRIDNDGNYCPENCRWATAREQGNNKSNNKYLSINGTQMTMGDVAMMLGMSYDRVYRCLSYKKYKEVEVATKFDMDFYDFHLIFRDFVNKNPKFRQKFKKSS